MSRLETLRQVTAEILERFFLMSADGLDEGSRSDEWRGEFVYSAISFKGPMDGLLWLIMPVPFACQLAIGIAKKENDAGTSSVQNADAVKELLCLICRELTGRLFDQDVPPELTEPSGYSVGRQKWEELAAGRNHIELRVENHTMLIELLMTSDSS